MRSSSGSERLGFSLGDAGGGFVEAQDPGVEGEERAELDDAAGAGGELGGETVGVAAQSEEVDDLFGFGSLVAVGAEPSGEEQGGAGEPGAVAGFEGDLQGLAYGEVAEQSGLLEGAAETDAGPAWPVVGR